MISLYFGLGPLSNNKTRKAGLQRTEFSAAGIDGLYGWLVKKKARDLKGMENKIILIFINHSPSQIWYM